MLVRDVARPDSKFFLKSEWGPASKDWPAVSYSKRSVGRSMQERFDPARDFIVYVGTTNPANTPEASHRSSLLSLVRIELRQDRRTRDLIPEKSWNAAYAEYGNRWMYGFKIVEAWTLDGFPSAYDYAQTGYSQLGNQANLGDFVELEPLEASAIATLAVNSVDLSRMVADDVVPTLDDLLTAPDALKKEVYRLANLIEQRRAAGNTFSTRFNKPKDANPRIETMTMIHRMWAVQKGACGLCQKIMPLPAKQGLLQPSIDRIESTSPSYKDDNVHITHLGCNLAKNKFSVDDFEDWLQLVRGGQI